MSVRMLDLTCMARADWAGTQPDWTGTQPDWTGTQPDWAGSQLSELERGHERPAAALPGRPDIADASRSCEPVRCGARQSRRGSPRHSPGAGARGPCREPDRLGPRCLRL